MEYEAIYISKHERTLALRSLKKANGMCCLEPFWRIISNKLSLRVKWTKMNLLKQDSLCSIPDYTNMVYGMNSVTTPQHYKMVN